MGFYDLILNYEKTSKMTNDEILEYLRKLYPKYDLYRFGLDWRDNKEYILKCRGAFGDIIVGWE